MKRTSAIIWGLILIAVGALVILKQQNIIEFGWNIVWPSAMLFIGIAFHIECFASNGKNYGLLVPGGILLVYGALFLYCELQRDWDAMAVLWPLFIIGPGFGLLELKLFSGGKQGSWIPVLILFTIGGIFLVTQTERFSVTVVIAAALIIMGIGVLASSVMPRGKKQTVDASPKQNDETNKTE